MTRLFSVCTALAFCSLAATPARSSTTLAQPELVAPAAGQAAAQPGAVPPVPQPTTPAPVSVAPTVREPAVLGDMTTPAACGSCDSGPDSGCSPFCCSNGWSLGDVFGGDCARDDAWTLQSCLTPCCDSPAYGGWIEAGYYNNNERLSLSPDDGLAFRDFPDHLNFDQVWLWVEKKADSENCSTDYGYRFDIMYGLDAQYAQAFGNPRALDGPNRGAWDASFDNGPYGWAMPQAYVEVARGDLSVKIGHFWTPAGYEVVPATGNFFYSHTLTQFNSEPFTHTGFLASYKASDCMTWYGGWTLGWDTGFDQFGGGNIFLGGFARKLSEKSTLTFITTVGDLGWRSGNQSGYTQHIVLVSELSDRLTWVLQSDYVHTDGTFADPNFHNEDYGATNYLFYKLNDCWSAGTRFEWWKSNNVTGFSDSFQDLTGGLNYHANANLVVRPEIRYDFTNEGAATQDYNQVFFGIDAVLTF